MKISIKDFQNQGTGYNESYRIDEKPKFKDFKLSKPIKMHVQLMRIDDGINVSIENLETEVELTCDKCLQKYPHKVKIPEAERIYYFRKPHHYDKEADQADIFMVDIKHQEVDLTELLRQEILLHFPTSQVCSSGCEGICPEKAGNCEYKPFKDLKKLL